MRQLPRPPLVNQMKPIVAGVLIAAGLVSGGERAARRDADGEPLPAEAVARFGSTRLKHRQSFISTLLFTPDGKTLLSLGHQEARAWDVAAGRQIRELPRAAGTWRPQGGTLSPDGKTLATPGETGVRLWDVASARPTRDFAQERSAAVRFSPDGKVLVSVGGSRGESISLWKVAAGKKMHSWTMDQHCVFWTPVAFTPDGATLLAVHGDRTLRYWDVATGKERKRVAISLESMVARDLVLSPDGKLAAVTSHIRHLLLIDVATGRELHRLLAPEVTTSTGRYPQRFQQVLFTPDGKTLLTTGIDDDLIFFDASTGKEQRRLKGGFSGALSVALSPDGKTLASASGGTTIRITDLATGRDLFAADGHLRGILGAAFVSGGKRLATAGFSKDVFVWDVATGRERRRLRGRTGTVDSVQLSADGKRIITLEAGNQYTIHYWDPESGRKIGEQNIPWKGWAGPLSPDGKTIVVLGAESNPPVVLRLFDLASGKEIASLTNTSPWGRCEFSPDGKTLVAGTHDGTVFLLDPATLRPRKQYGIYDEARVPIRDDGFWTVLSPDGKRLAYGSFRKSLFVLETETGKVLHRQIDLPNGVMSMAFSPAGTMLAWGDRAGAAIHLMELATGKERHRFAGTANGVQLLCFSPDGKVLLSGSGDTTAVAWDLTGRLREGWKPLVRADLNAAWADLASDDAPAAFRRIQQLAASPEISVPYLRARLKPVSAAAKERTDRLIADLDSDEYKTRERAAAELLELGEGALGACDAAIAAKPWLEAWRRLEAITKKVRAAWHAPSGDRLRIHRAMEALELCGTADSREVLASLAKGAAGAHVTEQANAALRRSGRGH